MKIRKLLGITMLLFASLLAFADTFDDVVNALKKSNMKEVSKFLNASVELTVLNNEGVYSKQQAEIILKNFLDANPPKNITIQHRGSSAQGSKYAIAVYECTQGKYRAYIFMKDNGSGMHIHEMRFEKE
jgi:hypothetical protein